MPETEESQAIEVEVLEIDGEAPIVRAEDRHAPRPGQAWHHQWQGRVRQLDSRWWPLWVFLGIIAVVLMLTVGLLLGVLFFVFRIIRGVIRAIIR